MLILSECLSNKSKGTNYKLKTISLLNFHGNNKPMIIMTTQSLKNDKCHLLMAQSTSWGQEELLRVKIKEQHFGVMLRIGASRRAFTVDY